MTIYPHLWLLGFVESSKSSCGAHYQSPYTQHQQKYLMGRRERSCPPGMYGDNIIYPAASNLPSYLSNAFCFSHNGLFSLPRERVDWTVESSSFIFSSLVQKRTYLILFLKCNKIQQKYGSQRYSRFDTLHLQPIFYPWQLQLEAYFYLLRQ